MNKNSGFVHPTATIDQNTEIADDVRVYSHSHINSGAIVERGCVIGAHVYIGSAVSIGKNSKIQNGAKLYSPAIIKHGVFIGPNAVLTNDRIPRAINPNGMQKKAQDWNMVGVVIEEGASVGAGAICVAPLVIGKWAMIGAGSIVTSDVRPHQMVFGNPARPQGWVCKCAGRLKKTDMYFYCTLCTREYVFDQSKREMCCLA